MLRAKNHAVAIPRAIGKRVAEAQGNFKQQDGEDAEKQVHGGLLCEWRILRDIVHFIDRVMHEAALDLNHTSLASGSSSVPHS